MKKIFTAFLFFVMSTLMFGQIYYQKVDKHVSVGVGKTEKVTQLVLLTNTPELELIVGDRFVKTMCNQLDKHNYEHIIVIPNFTLEIIKDNLQHGSVFINKREYSALDIGAAIAAAEWYCSYHSKNPKDFRIREFKPRPYIRPKLQN